MNGRAMITSSLRQHLPAGGPDGSRVRVAISPLATVGLLTFDAIQPRPCLGTPRAVRQAIRWSLDGRDRDVLHVLVRDGAPACLVGATVAGPASIAAVVCGPPAAGRRFDDALESLLAMAPDPAVAALAPGDPQDWLRGYATALRHAWREVEPLWRRTRVVLDQEAERLHAAAARGLYADLVATTSRITVCPTLAGGRATVVLGDAHGRPRALFQPAPGAGRATAGRLPPAMPLEALVGRAQAALLHELERPSTVERVAAALGMSPVVVELRVRRLARAGLVTHAHGDVQRTARGTLLLSLYDERRFEDA